MPLRVLAGPGCDQVGKDDYLEDELAPGDSRDQRLENLQSADGLERDPVRQPARAPLGARAAVGGDSVGAGKKN